MKRLSYLLLFILIFNSCKNEKKEFYFPNESEFLGKSNYEYIDLNSAEKFEKIISKLENLNYKSKKGYFKFKENNENYNILVSTSFGKCLGGPLIKLKNILSVSNDSLKKGENYYPIKDLKKIMKIDLENFGEKTEFSESHEKLVISVTCKKNQLNNLVLKIIRIFNEINSESNENLQLNLEFNRRMNIYPELPLLNDI